MGIANSVIRETASQVLRKEAAGAVDLSGGTASPVEKLQALLTRVRGGGGGASYITQTSIGLPYLGSPLLSEKTLELNARSDFIFFQVFYCFPPF